MILMNLLWLHKKPHSWTKWFGQILQAGRAADAGDSNPCTHKYRGYGPPAIIFDRELLLGIQ